MLIAIPIVLTAATAPHPEWRGTTRQSPIAYIVRESKSLAGILFLVILNSGGERVNRRVFLPDFTVLNIMAAAEIKLLHKADETDNASLLLQCLKSLLR